MLVEKKADVWMPLWIGAYLADTMKLTTIQHGAYFLLLMAYWRERAPLADDDEELRGITKLERAEWKKHRPVLAKFFRVGDGVWWHKRVEAEITAADANAKKASEKAAKAAQARWGDKPKQSPKDAPSNAPSIPQALPKDVLEECPTPSPLLPSVVSEPDGSGGEPPANPPVPPSPPPAPTPPPVAAQVTAATPKDIVFALGVPLLTAAGVKESNARSFLGMRSKTHGDAVLAQALQDCAAEAPVQPIPWLEKKLGPQPAGKAKGGHSFAGKDYSKGVNPDGSFT